MKTFRLNIPFKAFEPRYHIFKTKLVDYPIVIQRDDGYYRGQYNGDVWRVCTNDYCINAWFPTKEAAEEFVKSVDLTWRFIE